MPKTRTDLVPRPRLIERLNDGLPGKLILVSAPAGYGKTTLVTTWLRQLEAGRAARVCWLSLDEDDSAPRQFFHYLSAAVRPLPDVQATLPQLLQTNQPVATKTLMKAFVHDVTAVPIPFLLVLDDYNLLDSAEVDAALATLLERMPPHMTLALTSRSDPGFPIARIRARGDLVELRADDLRFTAEEAAVFLQQSMHLDLDPAQITALENRTEGWITGLKMAALSMQDRPGGAVQDFVQNFTGSHRFIMDYLSDEVLAHAAPDVQTFLLSTAVLRRLCAGLCDAVLPDEYHGHSQAYLEQLETTNTFLISLDDERRWYRYHHLFADLLRQKLPAAEAQSIRRRASTWSAQNGLVTDAIEYALSAKAWDLAVPLLVEHGLSFVFQAKLTTLRRWFDALPGEILMQQPRMCLDYAWTLVNQGENDAIEPYLTAAETASQCAPEIRTVTAIIRANSARVREDLAVMQAEASLSLQLAPPENALARGTALLQLGAVHMLAADGDPDAAVETLREAAQLAHQSGNTNTTLLSGGYLGLAYLLSGAPQAAAATLQATQSFAAQHSLEHSPLLAYTHLGRAHLALLDEQWAAARSAIRQAQAQAGFAGESSALFRSNLLLTLVEQAAGNCAAAEAALAEARETAAALKNAGVPQQLEYVQAVLDQNAPSPAAVQTARLLAAGAALANARAWSRPDAAPTEQPLVDPLSQRELEILSLIAAGLKNQEIAAQMFISLNTVLFHTKNIYAKLGVNKRTQAIHKARELDLLP
ncbi:MAG: LuxR C-terminal-related transcriptional regulator [Anaerolineaceae bacterium]|nr:LuxR C-terminal-related transcriptional regulator [Anaerolineaceae bacterium]